MKNEKEIGGKAASNDEDRDMLSEAVRQMNTDFPLSGAETEADFTTSSDDEATDDNISEREHLDTNFPLSGGEQ